MTGPTDDHLTVRLFDDGMSPLHRAGLGGLACTLRALERQYHTGLLSESKLPAPLMDGAMPWTMDDASLTLLFGRPEHAAEYFRRLFDFAFQIKDGLVYLPGQYSDPPPSIAVRAEMQLALARTLLQGAKKNIGLDPASAFTVDPDGDGMGMIEIEFQRCRWYLHQQVWPAFVDDKSMTLLSSPKKKVQQKNVNFGSLYPGAIKRHDVLSESDVTETTGRLLCCIFFLVGGFCVRMSRSGDGVLLVPDVRGIDEFVLDRPLLTPSTVAEVRVGSTADAAYQAEIRLRTRCLIATSPTIPSCFAQRFSLRTWTKPQKSRIDSVHVTTDDISRVEPERISHNEATFRQFERALAVLPRGTRVRNDETCFWVDSAVRPFIADNLAAHRAWYHAFADLAGTVQRRKTLSYERKGLNEMIHDDSMWGSDGEKVIIRATHTALRNLWGKIADTYRDRPELMFKKFGDEREKWGRIFAGAMSVGQFRKSLAEMFRRAGPNAELQVNWEHLLPMLERDKWEKARDLTLIGLCSYQGRAEATGSDLASQEESQA